MSDTTTAAPATAAPATAAPAKAAYPAKRQKVPPFARYKGTSAWHISRRRVRAYALFQAAEAAKAATTGVGAA